MSYRNLGSVRVVMAADGTAEQVNHYYAFGGLMGDSSGGDVQKYKYNGKELDRFLGWDMLDYGARWYDSKLQCWLTVDPLAEKYYHLSPYVYCADNPINAIDPDGKKIVIVGNREERIQVLTIMQRLTNDKLGVNQRGEVMILAHGTKNTAQNLKTGTGLVADVIGNSHTTAIQMGDAGTRNYYHPKFRKNTSNGKGTDGYINLDTSEIPSVVVKDSKSGKSKREKMSTSMVLGHELIHANRAMKGEDYEFDTQITYSYKDVDGKEYQTEEKANELETTGIVGNYIYTENKLRKEQGYNQRIKY